MVGSFECTSLHFLIVVIEYMYARVAQLVEYDLAKVGVAGSSPVSRSEGSLIIRLLFILYTFVTQRFANLFKNRIHICIKKHTLYKMGYFS